MENRLYLEQFSRSFAIVKKNMRIYYSKGPVIIFGLITPFFLFLSFYIGREMPAEVAIPGLLAMTAFFTATSVGPAIVPWESRARTLERLISSPISIWTILIGDVLSSFIFGAFVSLFPVMLGVFLGAEIVYPSILPFAILLATFCFASLSILLSAYPPTDTPAGVMMISSMVKFPLVFISGIFIPIEELPLWGRTISLISPLTYFTDLARFSIQGASYNPIVLDFAALLLFTVFFLVTAIKIHERTLQERL
ncbi:ABC transporter permease [Candidatus Bathyarchaeota archaeon]|nr:ABC transporter permease [Candidatus Bathyarchaeota archaeon]NIR12955.1 ABC transporter permease [Desulfobacterales bacterium]NIU81116.1 ABC transporter permease [Candidatus Bathyarchaeota archaeon]NIV67747.1 ABC transporter permease [Candidatus Bathyarchaeota archaeon]NIW16214.1 ABC transporter permease [Candidatus Bathyarchaeota archaeon]